MIDIAYNPVAQRQQTSTPNGQKSRLHDLRTAEVLGFRLAKASIASVAYWLADRAQSRTPTRVAFLNAHCANIARHDWKYAASLDSADALLPDGSGVAMAAFFQGTELEDNLNGTDLFAPLCRCLAFRRLPVFLLGGRPGVAERAAAVARERFPGLRIAGTQDGFFHPHHEDTIIREINNSGARVVFVAFGVPDQDIWSARVQARLNAPVILGVGGLFDFVSGRIKRAPDWMRQSGLEWIYRLKCEPQRMWRRYLIGNLHFLCHAARYAAAPAIRKQAAGLDRRAKRGLDCIVAATGLIMLSPLLAIVMLAIRLESRGPALFRQVRVGQNGTHFRIWKFRSMRTGDGAQKAVLTGANDRDDGVTFKLKHDPRVTRIGRFIRKYSIDELPQLWNVLRNEMSLVGPRPALPDEVRKYSRHDRGRLLGKPGLTCTWQISGRADLSFSEQVELDISYLKSRSIWLDLYLIARTPFAVLSARGAY